MSPHKKPPRGRRWLLITLGFVAVVFIVGAPTAVYLARILSEHQIGPHSFTIAELDHGEVMHVPAEENVIVTCPSSADPNFIFQGTSGLPPDLYLYEYTSGYDNEKQDNWNGQRVRPGQASTLSALKPGRTYFAKAGNATTLRCSAPAEFGGLAPGSVFFVDGADGSDTNDGVSELTPFQTLARAQTAVRAKIASGMTEDVMVLLRGGTYYDAHLDFTSADSGRDGHKVIWRNYPGETPKLVAGAPALDLASSGWTDMGGGIHRANIGAGRDVNVAYENDEFLLNARYPNGDFMFMDMYPNGGVGKFWSYVKDALPNNCTMPTPNQCTGFVYVDEDFAEIPEFLSCMTSASPAPDCGSDEGTRLYLWPNAWMNVVTRFTLDAVNHHAIFPEPLPYGLSDPAYHDGHKRFAYHVIGHRKLLDAPGEYFYDRQTGDFFVYPRTSITSANIVVPTRTSILSLRGTVGSKIRDVVIQGLELSGTDFLDEHLGVLPSATLTMDKTYPAPDLAAIYLENAENVLIEGNRIHHVGVNAIGLSGASQENVMYGNRIENVGVTAVFLNGDYILPDGSSIIGTVTSYTDVAANGYVQYKNALVNNEIIDTAQLMNGHNAVLIMQSGENVIAHNRIRGVGGGAFRVLGLTSQFLGARGITTDVRNAPEPFILNFAKQNFIAYNDVSKFMRFSADDGALYSHQSGIGNMIYQNDFHDIDVRDYDLDYMGTTSMNVIYFDQRASYFQVVKNLIRDMRIVNAVNPCDNGDRANSGCGVPVISDGEYNMFDNNIFDQTTATHAWSVQSTGGTYEGNGQFTTTRNIVYNSDPTVRFAFASGFYQFPSATLAASWNAVNGHPTPYPIPFQGVDSSRNIFYHSANTLYTVLSRDAALMGLSVFPAWNDTPLDGWMNAGFEQNSLSGVDPLFVDRAAGDYRFQAGSPAPGMGIEEINRSRIGTFAPAYAGIVPLTPLPLFTNQPTFTVSYMLADDESRAVRQASFNLSPGKQTFTIADTNSAGTAVSYPFEITLDTTPPVLTVMSPPVPSGSPLNIGNRQYLYLQMSVDGQRPFWKEFSFFSIGTYNLPYAVYDRAGNRAVLDMQVTRQL